VDARAHDATIGDGPAIPLWWYAQCELRRLRSLIAFVDRYVLLAGRSCCAGRSWASLDRSLARRAKDRNC